MLRTVSPGSKLVQAVRNVHGVVSETVARAVRSGWREQSSDPTDEWRTKRRGDQMTMSDHPSAGNAGIAHLFAIEHHQPGVPDTERSIAMRSLHPIVLMFAVAIGVVSCRHADRLICQSCDANSGAYRVFISNDGDTNQTESIWLCQACFDARIPSDVSRRIREAQVRGETNGIGWTSYQPITVGNKKQDRPDGAANGSQPIRSETNSTSSSADSRR